MLLYYAIVALHIFVCVILVLVVLLQSGKGADLAGAFGGGATQTAFGSRGPASFLSKITTASAIVFMLTSIGLSMLSGSIKKEGRSVLEPTKQSAKPMKSPQAAQQNLPPAPTPEQIRKKVEELEAAKQKQQQAAPVPVQPPASKPVESKPPAKNP